MKTHIYRILLLLGCFCFALHLVAQDSSIKYIMPYECSRLFPEQITEFQAYYNNEVAINNVSIADLQMEIAALEKEKQTRKVKRAKWALEEELEVEKKLKTDLDFYLNVWLEIEEFYDQRRTEEFLVGYNPTSCYTLYTLYDTLSIQPEELILREKKTNDWLEFHEPSDAEYIEEVEVITPASTTWVKKKADRNCLSADPNDCLVWCLVETPAEVKVLSRELNIIACPVSYEKSADGLRCEKLVKYTGDLAIAEREMAIYIEELKREVEVLDWTEKNCE